MAVTDLNTLLPRTAPQLAGCSDAIQMEALRWAARELCMAEIWYETLAAITMAIDADTATLTVPDGYDADILRVFQITLDDVQQDDSLWTFGPNNDLVLTAAVAKETSLVAQIVMMPQMTCHEYPDWLVSRFGDGIVAGALWQLKRQFGMKPARPWADQAGAQMCEIEFRRAIGRAKKEIWTGRQSGYVAVRSRKFV